MSRLWLEVTRDKYELPVAVADSIKELARIVGVSRDNIKSSASKHRRGLVKRSRFVSVEIEDEED